MPLKLEPGTKDIVKYPASGEFLINADNTIGEPSESGTSAGDGTYKLRATITWEINWTSTGGAGDALPNGTHVRPDGEGPRTFDIRRGEDSAISPAVWTGGRTSLPRGRSDRQPWPDR